MTKPAIAAELTVSAPALLIDRAVKSPLAVI